MKLLRKPGFSLLEALVVILIVGILAAIAIYSLNITRASNRDAKRISDISVIRAGLTQYWLQQATYPVSTGVSLGEPGAGADVLAANGFAPANQATAPVYLQALPMGPKANEYYFYHGSATGYSIKFTTERNTAYGPAGTWYAHSGGVDKSDVEK
ncbi:MAG: prepilin-type N-terminal cleavage/methylation domain-containing protein [Patescibacteria group bacterium]